MTTRKKQKEKRRQEILDIGLDLLIHKGFAATKISDIAKKAKMSIGLLFHYFKSKEHLYEELIKIAMSGPKLVISGDKSDPLAFFEATTKQILEYAVNDPTVAKMFVLVKQAAYNDATPDSVKEMLKERDALAQLALLIEKGQKNGTIRTGNPTALAWAYWAAIQGVCEELALNPGTPCPESEWIVDIIRRKE